MYVRLEIVDFVTIDKYNGKIQIGICFNLDNVLELRQE